MLAATSISFDLSVFEMFLPLSLGGRVIVVENALALPKSAAADAGAAGQHGAVRDRGAAEERRGSRPACGR